MKRIIDTNLIHSYFHRQGAEEVILVAFGLQTALIEKKYTSQPR